MSTFTQVINKIASLITSNNNREISASKMRDVLNTFVNASQESVADGQIPVKSGDKYAGSSNLAHNVSTGETTLSKIRLGEGVTNVKRIHNSGLLTVVDQKLSIPTVYYVTRSNKVDVIIGPAINIADLQAGMTTKSADGDDITLTDGMQVLLKNQADSAENGPYIVKTAEAPEVPDWYDSTKNQSIEVLTGSVSKIDLPAVPEGEAPVIAVDNGEIAFQLYIINSL